MLNRLTIIRGLPGAGKSTRAKQMVADNVRDGIKVFHHETDEFFMSSGTYKWEAERVGEAHLWCQQCVDDSFAAVDFNYNIIVSNTFLVTSEVTPYINIMKKHDPDCIVSIVDCLSQYQSVHGVPDATLDRMRRKKILGQDLCLDLLRAGCVVEYRRS